VTSASPIKPIARPNIRDDVYALLRSGILNHVYPPGHRLDLDELEQQLQVSRTPLKEALHKLESEGLIQILPRRGTFVSEIDPKNIVESYDVRLALELFIASIVVQKIDADEIAQLREIRQQMHNLLAGSESDDTIERYIHLDQEFHVRIVEASGNDRLIEIYRTIGGPLQMARLYQKFDRAVYLRYTEPEHDAILQALEERQVAALQDAFDAHVQRAKGRVLHLVDSTQPQG
jgi:GntR family transcriptional regulator, rspAB operon transcriptional repressor